MVRQTYPGLSDPKRQFEALKPLRDEIIRLQGLVRPFGPDYLILDAARKALDTAAYHFTREPDFFSRKPHSA